VRLASAGGKILSSDLGAAGSRGCGFQVGRSAAGAAGLDDSAVAVGAASEAGVRSIAGVTSARGEEVSPLNGFLYSRSGVMTSSAVGLYSPVMAAAAGAAF